MNCSGDNCRGWGLCSHMDSSAQEMCPFFVNSNPEVQSGMMTSPTSHRSGTLRPLALRAGTVPVLCYLPSLCNSELDAWALTTGILVSHSIHSGPHLPREAHVQALAGLAWWCADEG